MTLNGHCRFGEHCYRLPTNGQIGDFARAPRSKFIVALYSTSVGRRLSLRIEALSRKTHTGKTRKLQLI